MHQVQIIIDGQVKKVKKYRKLKVAIQFVDYMRRMIRNYPRSYRGWEVKPL